MQYWLHPLYVLLNVLQDKLQSDVRQWIVSGIRDYAPSFSNDSMGWLFMECPSGIGPSAAVISGWIYGSEADPANKYIKGMQKMVDSKAATKVGTQQVGILELMHACDNFVCILPYVKGTSDKIADICRKQLTHPTLVGVVPI